MHEIICPHCGKAFKIDETGYADILKQVRDSEFDQQLHERLELAERDKRTAVELATTKVASDLQKAAAAKDSEIQQLKARLDAGEVARKLLKACDVAHNAFWGLAGGQHGLHVVDKQVGKLVWQGGAVGRTLEQIDERALVGKGNGAARALVVRLINRDLRVVKHHVVVIAPALAPATAVKVTQAGNADGLEVLGGGALAPRVHSRLADARKRIGNMRQGGV